jgi:hypothetical protein
LQHGAYGVSGFVVRIHFDAFHFARAPFFFADFITLAFLADEFFDAWRFGFSGAGSAAVVANVLAVSISVWFLFISLDLSAYAVISDKRLG